ncbi:hypothetical protein MMC12_008180 [Toensbergia leucococca]|nr:hypothetical protein [Toensbergia leucococca]
MEAPIAQEQVFVQCLSVRHLCALSDSCIKRATIIDEFRETMTSTMSPDAEAQRIAIDTDGFLYLADSAVGMRAGEFGKKGWPRTNIEGLRFLKKHTVDDERIVNLLHVTLPGSKVGGYMHLPPNPARISCFIAPTVKERQALAVLIWRKGSRIVLYKGSHKLSVQPAGGFLMQLLPEQLAVDSVSPVTVDLKEGG